MVNSIIMMREIHSMAKFVIEDRFVVQVDILVEGIGGVYRDTRDDICIRSSGVAFKHNVEFETIHLCTFVIANITFI